MKKSLITAIALAFIFIFSCKISVPIVNGKSGCWYENEVSREVCGVAEKYTSEDSTYVMRTYDGWAMKVKANKITWK